MEKGKRREEGRWKEGNRREEDMEMEIETDGGKKIPQLEPGAIDEGADD